MKSLLKIIGAAIYIKSGTLKTFLNMASFTSLAKEILAIIENEAYEL